ncbi:uncharacterized protein METZ01_LOCUS106288 [marine metagenome]|uniref:Uncharacterized protein n=1 Tax=marine metagenome TaxID=408172 RepID=A0A381WLS2_9ZZZZ
MINELNKLTIEELRAELEQLIY